MCLFVRYNGSDDPSFAHAKECRILLRLVVFVEPSFASIRFLKFPLLIFFVNKSPVQYNASDISHITDVLVRLTFDQYQIRHFAGFDGAKPVFDAKELSAVFRSCCNHFERSHSSINQ
ncbi:MAG: hypothetical protein ACI92G_004520 [Candidatus Pelagisphaera sp.]|jgi:hypothetical protein